MIDARKKQYETIEPAKVLMYSPDSIGLGHMRRNSAIAHGLVKELPGVSNLLLVGSSAGVYFDLPPGTDCVKLPSILKTGHNQWAPKSLNVSNEVAWNIRSRIIRETALALEPDVFLVDHVPSGIWDELIPTLKALKAKPKRSHLVLGLRDILGAPEEVRMQWEASGVYELIDEYYDNILFYGTSDVFPTADIYGLSERFADRIRYCGFVHLASCPVENRNDKAVNRLVSNEVKPKVLLTAGGGHDAFPMMQFALKAILTQGAHLQIELVVITGPLMPALQRSEIMRLANQLSATCIDSTKALQTYLDNANVLITMGGYNTVMEAVAAEIPTIIIPRTGPSAEQRCRASLFAEMGLTQSVDLEFDTPQKLISSLTWALKTPRRATSGLRFDGVANAAKILADLVRSKRVQENTDTQILEAVA